MNFMPNKTSRFSSISINVKMINFLKVLSNIIAVYLIRLLKSLAFWVIITAIEHNINLLKLLW